ncbi:MAG: dehydrogenase [Nitrospirae bacterium]|nr:dehydrogenase [Magnetococcales bacterium]HAT51329.1 dehydrogenase [Alphaproteobacteria bacterium]
MITLPKLISLYRHMAHIRLVEEGIADRYGEEGQLMRCPIHLCVGQEAIAVGVSAHLRPQDGVFGTHRSHGHYLAKGGNLPALLAELYGKEIGCCQGRGGSMHLIDRTAGFLGAVPIVSATIPLAVGAAWAGQRLGDGSIAVVFFGDGCFEEGVLHETMNFASLRKIPILFVCENNRLSINTLLQDRQPDRPIHGIAQAHGLAVYQADGNDVEAVWEVALHATQRARAGEGPSFLELSTYRTLEHCGPGNDDAVGYRPVEELATWRDRCPLEITSKRLQQQGVSLDEITQIGTQLKQEIDQVFIQVKAAPLPENTLGANLFAPSPSWPLDAPATESKRHITFFNAIREASSLALAQDPNLFLIGEGIPSDPAGVFGTIKGLKQEFGSDRVMDMPVAENGLTGICIGAALRGVKPVMVYYRIDFLYLAMDQLANVAAKWHYLFHQPVPIVVRAIIGRGWGQGPQHSQSLQAIFGHIPGLKVVMPVTAQDAKGMLLAAVADPNPVLFLEHRWLHSITGEVPEGLYCTALDRARRVRAGKDVTIAAFSLMVLESIKAAEILAQFGVDCEVIDMRSVQPLDIEPVLESVTKTGRLLVADTGWTSCGMGAEIVARVVERAFTHLKVAPIRIGLPDYPTPTAPSLAYDYYPDAETVGRQVIALLDPATRPHLDTVVSQLRWQGNRDTPNPQFKGPF